SVEANAGRTVADMGDGRDLRRRRLRRLQAPEPLRHPRAAARRLLIADPPSAVGPFRQIRPASRVAGVAVVVPGPEVPLGVEREVLRVAHSRREDLESRAVRIASHDAAGVRIVEDRLAVLLDMDAAVADREVELPVGAETEAVQVMADEREADAEAGVHHPALFGLALDLLEVPEVRDA